MAVQTLVAPIRRVRRLDVARVSLSGFAVLLLLEALVFVAYRVSTPSDGTKVGGSGNPYAADGLTVVPQAVSAPGLSGLQADDRVTQLFGRPADDWANALLDPTIVRPALTEGEPVEYVVVRNGEPIQVTVRPDRYSPADALAEDWGVLVLALAMQIVGLYLFARRPREPAARAFLVMGTAMFASTAPWILGMQASDLAQGTGFWLYTAATGFTYALFWSSCLHLALVFPRPIPFATHRGRTIAFAYLVPMGIVLALVLGAALANGQLLAAFEAWSSVQGLLEVAVILLTIGLMTYSYLRLVDSVGRRQLGLLAGAVALAGFSGLLLWFGPQLVLGAPLLPRSAVALLGLPFPIALGAAISRLHLFDLDVVVNRSLVYVGLTAGVVAIYAGAVTALGRLIPGNAPFAAALLGAGAVAIAALPLRDLLQRRVNRLMYGDRHDPDSALRRLGHRLEASVDPQTVLTTLVQAVAESLRSPFVGIELEGDGAFRVEASSGSVPIDPTGERELRRFPIVYRGVSVGRLVLAQRAADESFSDADERLVADLARQAAPAVEAVRLTADLRRSREELVAAREEERRRLRRDLHDELGPAMAGSLMKLRAARSLLATDPARAATLFDELDGGVGEMIDEIRRIARDLRPPALDELGLVGLLRMQVATFDAGPAARRLHVSLEAPDQLPPLPAAVEVAALRIALEGLVNAARHSGGSRAHVRLAVDGDALVVEVGDDGSGVPQRFSPGVGMTSMRERAEELGGSVRIESPDGHGTRVLARLPIASAAAP
jgi:two-component system, NarL family, sensor kinase